MNKFVVEMKVIGPKSHGVSEVTVIDRFPNRTDAEVYASMRNRLDKDHSRWFNVRPL